MLSKKFKKIISLSMSLTLIGIAQVISANALKIHTVVKCSTGYKEADVEIGEEETFASILTKLDESHLPDGTDADNYDFHISGKIDNPKEMTIGEYISANPKVTMDLIRILPKNIALGTFSSTIRPEIPNTATSTSAKTHTRPRLSVKTDTAGTRFETQYKKPSTSSPVRPGTGFFRDPPAQAASPVRTRKRGFFKYSPQPRTKQQRGLSEADSELVRKANEEEERLKALEKDNLDETALGSNMRRKLISELGDKRDRRFFQGE